MTITLAVGATSVELPADLYWSDEAWSPVAQTEQRTITGALVLQSKQMLSGRPITLAPIDPNSAWTPESVLAQVKAWAAVAGQQMTLTLRSTVRTVVFRHHDGPAIEATPVVHYSDVDSGDHYLATYKFTEYEE